MVPSVQSSLKAGCLVLMSVLNCGCGNDGGAADAAEIAQTVAASQEFNAPQVVYLKTRAGLPCSQALVSDLDWSRWEGLGLGSTRDVVGGEGASCQFTLSENARLVIEAHQHVLKGNFPGGADPNLIAAPLAVRNLTRVVSSRRVSDETWEAEVEWHWNPNSLGERMGVDVGPKTAWAVLGIDAGGWRLLSLRLGP